MKTIRSQYPPVRQYVKAGNTYYEVDKRRKGYVGPKKKNFSDREAALQYASDIAEKVAKSGLDSINQVNADPRLIAWTEQAAQYNETLEQIVARGFADAERERKIKESPHMGELITSWMDEKTSSKLTPLRERSKKSIRNMADTFQKDFGMIKIKEVTEETVRDWLNKKNVSNQTRKNLCNYLGQFFNWCKAKKYHNENPTEFIEIHVANGSPEYFNVEECKKIMGEAKKHPDMTAYFALCLFAGIRPEEVERMTWGTNIKMNTKEIFLQPEITKTKKARMFPMSPTLFQWLQHCENVKPLVPVRNVKNLIKPIHKSVKWIHDGLRHTFATFHYAKEQNLEKLRYVMGNSPKVIERFYRGVISQTEIERFWNITPASIEAEQVKEN